MPARPQSPPDRDPKLSARAWGAIEAGLPERLAQAGIREVTDLAALRGDTGTLTLITSARTRRCFRLEDAKGVLFLKVQDLRGVRLHPSRLPSYLCKGSPVRREVEAAKLLFAHGLAVPRYLAFGERRGLLLPRLAWCISAEVEGHLDLERYLRRATTAADRLRAMDLAEELVRGAHAEGLVLLGAKYRNLLVPSGGPTSTGDFVLIDQPDAHRSRSARLRKKDLRHLAADRERADRQQNTARLPERHPTGAEKP